MSLYSFYNKLVSEATSTDEVINILENYKKEEKAIQNKINNINLKIQELISEKDSLLQNSTPDFVISIENIAAEKILKILRNERSNSKI